MTDSNEYIPVNDVFDSESQQTSNSSWYHGTWDNMARYNDRTMDSIGIMSLTNDTPLPSYIPALGQNNDTSLASGDDNNNNITNHHEEQQDTKVYQKASFKSNERGLLNLKTNDLIESFTKIYLIRNPLMQFVRDSCPSYYNWVIVDLCRRMNLIEYHFRKIYNENYEEKIRRKVLDSLANEIQSGHIDKYNSFGHTKDDEYFDYFTCFIPKKRTRVLRITRIFGDEICLFTEFIDFKAIGDMKHDEFIAFYHDLLLCKDRLKECLAKVREDVKKVFQGDPTEPYKRVDVLNHEI